MCQHNWSYLIDVKYIYTVKKNVIMVIITWSKFYKKILFQSFYLKKVSVFLAISLIISEWKLFKSKLYYLIFLRIHMHVKLNIHALKKVHNSLCKITISQDVRSHNLHFVF